MQKELGIVIFFCLISSAVWANTRLSDFCIAAPFLYRSSLTDTLILPLHQKIHTVQIDDTTALSFYILRSPCKGMTFSFHPFYNHLIIDTIPFENTSAAAAMVSKKKDYIHGDISYDFYQHQTPDTSFAGQGFTQHQVIANVYAKLGANIPVVFHFATLQTSMPYMKNYVDGSIQFDNHQYTSSMFDELATKMRNKMAYRTQADSLLHNNLVQQFNQIQSLTGWLQNDKQMQDLLHANQVLNQYRNPQQLASNVPITDSNVSKALGKLSDIRSLAGSDPLAAALDAGKKEALKRTDSVTSRADSLAGRADSLKSSNSEVAKAIAFVSEYEKKLRQLKNYKTLQDSLKKKYDSLHVVAADSKDSLEKKLMNSKLSDLIREDGDSLQHKGMLLFLLGVKKMSLGLSYVDYSELSAKNINILGLNMEYYDKYYFALAVGKINYRYMDFLTPGNTPSQNLLIARFGVGPRDGKHLYFTAYTGKKQASYYINNQPATTKVTGYTVEGRFPINENIYVTAEAAKSIYPQYAGSTSPGKMTNFSDRSNEAYSVQLNGFLPKTDTRFFGVYNRLGVNFQSFNIFNNNANTSAWQARVDQYLMKKRLMLSASVRQNDFSTPYVVNSYKSTSVFYSFLATLSVPKWPSITVGYMPYTQLTNINGQIEAVRFYTMMGTANYFFRLKKSYWISSLVYNRYFNNSNQQGLMYYDATSWFMNQSVIIKTFTLTGSCTISYSPGYDLVSAGPGMQWRISQALQVGAGVKYNVLNHTDKILGYNGSVDFMMGKLGRISLSYDRGYIPSYNNQLFQNNWGRANYTKNF